MKFKIPFKKNKQEIDFYIKEGPKFGSILKEIKTLLENGEFNNSKEIEIYFRKRCKEIWDKNIKFPFVSETNILNKKFGYATCISINHVIAHGRPLKKNKINSDDIISVDCGLSLKFGKKYLNFDAAFTTTKNNSIEWIKTPQLALSKIYEQINNVNNNIRSTTQISEIIEKTALNNNLGIVLALTGHGIGYLLHEMPYIHNARGQFKDVKLFDGLCFCAEPIYGLTKNRKEVSIMVYVGNDGWQIKSINRLPTSHFETMFCYTNNQLVDLIGISNMQW